MHFGNDCSKREIANGCLALDMRDACCSISVLGCSDAARLRHIFHFAHRLSRHRMAPPLPPLPSREQEVRVRC